MPQVFYVILVRGYYHFKALWWMSCAIAYPVFGCSRRVPYMQDMLITIQARTQSCYYPVPSARPSCIYVLWEIERLAFVSPVFCFLVCLWGLTVNNTAVSTWSDRTESWNVWSKTIGALHVFLIVYCAWTSAQVYSTLKHITAHPSVFINRRNLFGAVPVAASSLFVTFRFTHHPSVTTTKAFLLVFLQGV